MRVYLIGTCRTRSTDARRGYLKREWCFFRGQIGGCDRARHPKTDLACMGPCDAIMTYESPSLHQRRPTVYHEPGPLRWL